MSGALKLSGVTLPGTGYENIVNMLQLALPVTTGLLGLYQIGGSAASSLGNLANPALPLTMVGAPTINTVGAVCSQANCFDTGILELAEFTYLAVAQETGNSAIVMGNYLGSQPGANMYQATNSAGAKVIVGGALDAGGALVQTTRDASVAGSNNWSISGTTLTVTAVFVDSNGFAPGQLLTAPAGSGLAAGTTIVSQLTGTPGGTGTYQVSVAQTSSGSAGLYYLTANSPSVPEWNIMASRVKSGSAGKVSWSRNGLLLTTTGGSAIAGRTPAARNVRIGGHYDAASFLGTQGVLAAAVFNTFLSDTDLASCCSALRSFYAQGGVTTL